MFSRIMKLFSDLIEFIDDYSPVECFVCNKYLFKKDATYRDITTGYRVSLCPSCDKNLFHPFTKGD